MNSAVLPSFWKSYRRLTREIRQSARKAYRLWAENPFHPSLHFKCINSQEGIWSVRISIEKICDRVSVFVNSAIVKKCKDLLEQY